MQLSLLGSVISNLLLVLGTAFIAGGIRNTSQTFNQQARSRAGNAVAALCVPACHCSHPLSFIAGQAGARSPKQATLTPAGRPIALGLPVPPAQGIGMNCALLLLGVVAVLLPSLLSETKSEAHENASELWLSRFESIFLLLVYLVYLVFQLVTHRWVRRA